MTYMAAATEGKPCVQFPSPTEPISYQPFFGKYATTGAASVKTPFEDEQAPGAEPTTQKKTARRANTKTPPSGQPDGRADQRKRKSPGGMKTRTGRPGAGGARRGPTQPPRKPAEPPVGGAGGAEPPNR